MSAPQRVRAVPAHPAPRAGRRALRGTARVTGERVGDPGTDAAPSAPSSPGAPRERPARRQVEPPGPGRQQEGAGCRAAGWRPEQRRPRRRAWEGGRSRRVPESLDPSGLSSCLGVGVGSKPRLAPGWEQQDSAARRSSPGALTPGAHRHTDTRTLPGAPPAALLPAPPSRPRPPSSPAGPSCFRFILGPEVLGQHSDPHRPQGSPAAPRGQHSAGGAGPRTPAPAGGLREARRAGARRGVWSPSGAAWAAPAGPRWTPEAPGESGTQSQPSEGHRAAARLGVEPRTPRTWDWGWGLAGVEGFLHLRDTQEC